MADVRRESGSDLSPTRWERRKVETRERLFEAAMQLLSERDFDEVTVEMITRAADVGKGTFFNYFENKEAVVGYFFESQYLLFKALLEAHPPDSLPFPPQAEAETAPYCLPVWNQMRTIGHLVSERETRSKRLTRTLMALGLVNPQVREASLRVRQQVIALVAEIVRQGQASRELRDDLPPEAISAFLAGIYFNTLYNWSRSETDESIAAMLDHNFALAFQGVCHADAKNSVR